jgi:hypothetical protein
VEDIGFFRSIDALSKCRTGMIDIPVFEQNQSKVARADVPK